MTRKKEINFVNLKNLLFTINYRTYIHVVTGNFVLAPDSQDFQDCLDSGLSAHFQIPVVLSDVGCQLVELLRGDTPV